MKYKEKLNQIKVVLGIEVKLEQMKLDNGTIIEAEIFEPDNEVFVVTGEDRVPVPIGEYVLEDGKILVIAEEGIIAEIKEAVVEEEEAPEGEAPPEQEMESAPASPKKIVESISKELFFAEIEKLRGEIAELKLAKVEPVKEEIKTELAEEVKPIVTSPEVQVEKRQTNLYSQNKSKTIQSTVWDKISNIKH